MSVGHPLQKSSAPKPWVNRILYIVVGLLVVIGIGFLVIINLGYVVGEEINPNTFERRNFSFRRFPYTEIQISPSDFTSLNSNLKDHLVDNKLIPNSRNVGSWQVVYSRTGNQTVVGDPKILTDLLDVPTDRNESYWIDWSANNLAKAKIFWPIVNEIAVNQAYLLVPEFFEFVRQCDPEVDDMSFRKSVTVKLAELYEQLADDLQGTDDHERAVTFYKAAISHDNRRENAKTNLAKSLQILDQMATEATNLPKASD